MIPKIIHYCWFGKKEKSKEITATIAHWKEKLPEYRFIEWNEDTFDVALTDYSKQAYAAGKMAFVSDVARVYALYHHGGVYLDTDVEIRRDFSPLLAENPAVLGFENSGKHVMTAFMAGEEAHVLWRDLLSYYQTQPFIDSQGKADLTPNTTILTNQLQEVGLKKNNTFQQLPEGVQVHPEDFFSAYDFKYMEDISTSETYTIHHCHASWMPKKNRINFFIKSKLITLIGHGNYRKFYKVIGKIKQ